MFTKRGQLTIFIIVGIIAIAVIAAFFIFRGEIFGETIPQDIKPVYDYFLSCAEAKTSGAIAVMEAQGGYIEKPEFEPGNTFMPFSNQLDFNGFGVPYWYYVTGNGFQKEQIPRLNDMESDLAREIEKSIEDCNFKEFELKGYSVEILDEPKASSKISNKKVSIQLSMPLRISRGESSATLTGHNIEINSELGGLYESAKKIYVSQNSKLILENYARDVLYLYAPVNGVDIQCSPKIWKANEVSEEILNALEANIGQIKTKGNYYELNNKLNKYFVRDFGTSDSVNFLFVKSWPHKIEISPSEGSLLVAESVGNQEGLGILGFCYVPYHFVYNVAFPVLIQVNRGNEFFQFPVAVVIKDNQPRKSIETEALIEDEEKICKYKNNDLIVETFDAQLNPVSADISYRCLGETCYIGESENGVLEGKVPQCLNGQVIARAEGYTEKKAFVSTNIENSISIVLDKIYEKNIKVLLGGQSTSSRALVSFVSSDNSATVFYPEQNTISLSEGLYNVSVQVFSGTNINFAGANTNQCVEIPKSGIQGILGMTEEKCYQVSIPSQTITDALIGGGKTEGVYIFESDLKNSGNLVINVPKLTTPKNLEDLQMNYEQYEINTIGMELK